MLYDNRERAESFGAFADRYDRFRPTYPEALFDLLGPFKGLRVLDVGCGTGKAARRFAQGGAHVLGLDVDVRMAEVAERHGIDVEIGSFETWDANGRTFDLVTCGQAWHWIDPKIGAEKAADTLGVDGRLAAFWNYGHPKDEALEVAIERAFEQTVPELAEKYARDREWESKEETTNQRNAIDESGRFEPCEQRAFPWQWQLRPEDWLDLLQTHSDIALLANEDRSALFAALGAVVGAKEHDLVFEYETFCLLARKVR